MYSVSIFFAGSTERQILRNFEEIVERSLPLEKVVRYYEECSGAGKEVVLNFVTYLEERKMVSFLRLICVCSYSIIMICRCNL